MAVSPPARLQITGLLSTDLVAQVAAGESVIKCRCFLNVLNNSYARVYRRARSVEMAA